MGVAKPDEKIRFGSFEADLASGELRKGGIKLKIQPQPFQILRLLLRRPGDMVSREYLRQELWPGDTYGEFDVSLNTVVNRLRRVLNDDPQQPRYIETLPRVGYRFIFPVELIARESSNGSPSPRPLSVGPPATDTAPRPRLEVVQAGTPRPTRDEASSVVLLSRRRRRVEIALALVFCAALLTAIFQPKAAVEDKPVRRWSFSPEGLFRTVTPAMGLISPDGRHIAYAVQKGGERSLWLRSLDNETAREVAGTEGALAAFWSPDSRTIGYATDGELKRTALDGSAAVTVCELPSRGRGAYLGGTWSPDGSRIVFSSEFLLYEVAAAGGEPTLLFSQEDPIQRFSQPHFLPTSGDSEALAYTTSTNFTDRKVGIVNLATGEHRLLGPGAAPAYSPDGFLVSSLRGGGLTAWPFSPETLAPTGEPFRISDSGGLPSFSNDGVMAYYRNPARQRVLTWKDRVTGEALDTVGQIHGDHPAISLDGNSAVFVSSARGSTDVWIADLHGSGISRLTTDPGPEQWPTWSPDGSKAAYGAGVAGTDRWRILGEAASGDGEPEVLVEREHWVYAPNWSSDGRYLAFAENPRGWNIDISYVELDEQGNPSEPKPFLDGLATEYGPKFSPNVRYLAYTSDDGSGRQEIFVASFPDATDRKQISAGGGNRPRWRSDGRELYYLSPLHHRVMAVSVTQTERGLQFGRPEPLFDSGVTGYFPSADGQRFLVAVATDREPEAIHVVENWAQAFR